MALMPATKDDAIDLLFALAEEGPESVAGKDHWGRYTVVLSGNCYVTFEVRDKPGHDPPRYIWVFAPIEFVEPEQL
ncbi:MAG: hypothetical protein WD276_06740 [Actinomycetota bacterium]